MIRTHGVTHHDPDSCFGCRVRTVSMQLDPFDPHYNWSVGSWVNSRRQFVDELHRASDRQSAVTGIDADYQPRELRDTPPDGS